MNTITAASVGDDTTSGNAVPQVGQHRYRICRTNGSSDKYGNCEVCNQHVPDVVQQIEERFYRHATGRLREGWTQAGCRSGFGHEACLKARRRGSHVFTMTEGVVAYDVHAGPDLATSRHEHPTPNSSGRNSEALLQRATSTPTPRHTGEWAALLFRPDAGSLQEYVVGLVFAGVGASAGPAPVVRWVPAVTKLCLLYEGMLSSEATLDLFAGVERALTASFRGALAGCVTGSPHCRLHVIGYLALDDLDGELNDLLKRHASAIWAD